MEPTIDVILSLLNKKFYLKEIEDSIKCDNNPKIVVYILSSCYI